MPDVTRRRHLVQEDKEDFDCCLTFDVNEYLIDNWPTLTFRNRQSVWSICQNNDEFDWDVVEDQIIDCIYDLAEADSTVVLPEQKDGSEDEEDDSFYDDVIFSVTNYIEYTYEDMEEEAEDFAYFVIDKLDDLLTEYYESDDEDEDEDVNESTES